MTDVPPEHRTIPALLERAAAAAPSKTFLRFEGSTRTFAETCERAAQYAGTLAAAGVEPGDRVAVMLRNGLEFVDLWLAACWRGAILVPINVASRGAQLEHVLVNAQPRVLVAEHDLLPSLDYVEVLPESVERLWLVGAAPADSTWRGLAAEALPGPGERLSAHAVGPGDLAAIMYTGGTTGPSKGVCCPHAQCYWWGVNVARNLEIDRDSVLYTVLPLFHTNALNALSQALVHVATFSFGRRFSASRFWSEVAAADATHTYVIGAMVSILLKQPPSSVDTAHRVRRVLGPAAPPDAIVPFEQRFGVRIVQGYGSTETNTIMCNMRGPYKLGAMGQIAPEFEARVVDEDDVEVADGTAGELLLRHREPFSFASGYWRLPEATATAWRNLWFHTGDRVVRDADGVYWFKDRLKDAIRRRGENISSYEVEQVLQAHPDVARAAVVPVPSELGEDEVMAFVVLREEAAADPLALVRHCEPRLAYFAIPRYVEFVGELPLTEVGRVQKFVLRERGIGEATWDRDASGYVVARP